MPWNGSGTYTLPYNWVNDANASIPITASRVDGQDGDIANALNNCLTRDGQGTASANLSMSGFKHTNCAAGVADTDYATMAQLNLKASLASPTFTGVPAAPTPSSSDNSTTIATTAYVKANLANYAPTSSPTFTGTLTAPIISATTVNASSVLAGSMLSSSGIVSAGNSASLAGTGICVELNYRTDLGYASLNSCDRTSGFTALPLRINASNVAVSGSLSLGSGTSIPKITISTSAPGTLALNEIWLQRAP